METQSDREEHALGAYIKLMRAAETVTARLESGLRDAGLTTTQFGVLEAIYHLGPLSLGELARKNLKSCGNLTLVVDNLERRGLVTRRRDPSDRRRVGVRLTPSGSGLIAGLFPRHARAIVDTFSVLESEDQHELARLCRRLGLSAAQKLP